MQSLIKHYKNFEQILTLESAHKKDGRKLSPKDLSVINNGSVVFDDKEILWVGKTQDLPTEYKRLETKDYSNHVLIPEIIDSHTHLVFGGDRSFEYSMRLDGADYEAIATAGGGILNTMESTVGATEEELFQEACERIKRMNSYGVGTIEIKTGYGLTYESELKSVRVIQRLKKKFSPQINVLCTYMAAHAVPKEYKTSRSYLEEIVLPLMQELAVKGLIDFVDIFHEKGYFSKADCELLFTQACKLNLKIKIHADEFNDNGGAKLAADFKAVSADHLLASSEEGARAIADSRTVATLLPGTAFFLGKPLADARMFLDAGCKVALASDYNPGSCHCDNLLMIAQISAKSLKLNSCELWSAVTLNAAAALDLKDQGAIVKGLRPRFTIFKTDSADKVLYNWGRNFAVTS